MKILSVMMIDPAALTPPTQDDMTQMGAFIAELKARGALVDTGGRMPGMLELMISRNAGKTTVTDGPFTEAKEVVGGFALLEVKDRDEAIAVTNTFLDLIGNATCYLHEVDETP